MGRNLLTFIFAMGFGLVLNAQWVSPGNGTTYTPENLVEVADGCVTFDTISMTYLIVEDITISANDKLYVNANDTQAGLRFAGPDLTLTIKGAMEAVGMDTVTPLVIGQAGDLRCRIRFEDATGPSTLDRCCFSAFSGIQIINSKVAFEHCTFSGMDTYHQTAAVTCMHCDPVFTHCGFSGNQGAGISSPANGHSSPQLLHCLFTNNVTANTNHPQVNLGPGSEDTIRIVNCTIEGGGHDQSGGISITDLMGVGNTTILLKDNVVRNNRYGYNQQGNNLSSVIVGNAFLDNNLETNPMMGGSGISIYGTDENNKAFMRGNIITGNLWGITAINAFDINLGTMDDWGNNQIQDNGNNGGIYDLYNNSAYGIAAIGNQWGSTDENEVEHHIFHQHDDPALGLVSYVPFIGYENTGAAETRHFTLSPNPIIQGRFTLKMEEAIPSEMAIYNTKGQLVKSQYIDNQLNIINIGNLVSGIYFVEVRNEQWKTVTKIMVE